MPLRVDIDDVIKPRLLGRRLDVPWLKHRLHDFIRLGCDFVLHRIRHARSRSGAVNPLSWYSCHIHILQSLRPVIVFCTLSPALPASQNITTHKTNAVKTIHPNLLRCIYLAPWQAVLILTAYNQRASIIQFFVFLSFVFASNFVLRISNFSNTSIQYRISDIRFTRYENINPFWV